MELAYYSIGLNPAYCDALLLSIRSLRLFNPLIDILVLCDTSMIEKCRETLKDLRSISYLPMKDSQTPQEASSNKIRVFEYLNIFAYKKVMYIDTDIVIHTSLDSIFSHITNPIKLYAYAESTKIDNHTHRYWSHMNEYSSEDLKFFEENKIYTFCAGCYAFIPTIEMQTHFSNILHMMKTHVGDFFYEQSFMNVYFNRKNLVDTNVFTPHNFQQGENIENNPMAGKLMHFCGCHSGSEKIRLMTNYINNYLRF